MSERGINNDSLAVAIGFSAWVESGSREFDLNAARADLRALHKSAEYRLAKSISPPGLHRNVVRLAELVGLSETDCRILEFAALIHTNQLLEETADLLDRLSNSRAIRALSVLLTIPEPEIRVSLSGNGVLAQSGLVVLDRGSICSLRSKLDLLSHSFASLVVETDADPLELLRGTVSPSSAALLTMDDFEHVAPSLSILRPYFERSIATGRVGVNVFLYGSPGTGKSQLAKVVAADLGCELFEVASEDSDGDPVTGTKRLRAFRAAQRFFTSRKAIILFDEAEDVFNDGGGLFGRKSTAQTHKAWINRILEDNVVPTIWLSNSVDCMDPAFIRRFDIVVEIPVPNRSQRERIIRDACAGFLDTQAVSHFAEYEDLSPAVVAKASSVLTLICSQIRNDESTKAFELLVRSTLQAQGHRTPQKIYAHCLPDVYDPAFIHADSDLGQVAAGLVQSRAGRLCLYGPPGTGKTAFGRWLAGQMGVPLIVKRASDLMSKWVGENEKNIARAFGQAERDGALLLIDEVDSFLRDRRDAKSGWEASMVNEMLTQMESFSGVFIASTNLMVGLDQAALRRFDLKVKFDFLKPAQARELLAKYCDLLKIAAPESEHSSRLVMLGNLTPGDFAAVARQSRFRPIESATELVATLEAECALKESCAAVQHVMGFLS